MREYLDFYIGGAWVKPLLPTTMDVTSPASEQVIGRISLGGAADVEAAVQAARAAFPAWSTTSREERVEVLARIVGEYRRRLDDIAHAVSEEMGAPLSLSRKSQATSGLAHLETALTVLQGFEFREKRSGTWIAREPIGVCALITPWNWPMNQIACKVAPALATGCTIVLKPSEIAPFSACVFAEVLHSARVPAGVFNLINGDGPTVGQAMTSHPEVDMVSFTGSTRAGIEVARSAALGVKRVAQELGGKSPLVILPDADLEKAVAAGVRQVTSNSGQSCNAATRMLVHRGQMEQASAIAKRLVEAVRVGDPATDVDMGPVVSRAQWQKIQDLIAVGIAEGATLVTGGPGRPAGLDKGHYVRPTVFSHVDNGMRIARQEIFGPVLTIIPYDSIDQAIAISNDTEYGLAAYVWGADQEVLARCAAQLRAGRVCFNGASGDLFAPFGGYKQSGNGREWGEFGFHEYLETKAILGLE
jgi:aldehyde dehydrogenase (NAD+)